MDKSDHHDYNCLRCEIEVEVSGRKRGGGVVLEDPTYCPYCRAKLKKKKEIILTVGLMTTEEVARSMAKSLREAEKKYRKPRR